MLCYPKNAKKSKKKNDIEFIRIRVTDVFRISVICHGTLAASVLLSMCEISCTTLFVQLRRQRFTMKVSETPLGTFFLPLVCLYGVLT